MDIAYRGYRIYAILTPGEPYLVVKNRHIWQKWADALHRWGVKDVVATLLEATEPLNFIGAQVVYLSQPIITQILPEDHINAFADLLEDPDRTKAFTRFLRQGQVTD
jgi:hypothetical protein